jgi:type IV pilus assembly protein PilA
MKKTTQGFTLIELLVVIAIIGILSSIVIASLNSARNKGKDAAIRGQMKQLQTQAEIFYDTNGSRYATTTVTGTGTACAAGTNYVGSVFANANVAAQIVQIAANDAPNSNVACHVSTDGLLYALSITGLNNGSSLCIDNTNGFKASSTAQTTGLCN